MSFKGSLYIISAPSGGGKTSLVSALTSEFPDLKVSISHTTRAARENEIDAKDYFFVENAQFMKLKEEGAFLESAKVFEHWYATSKEWVLTQLQKGLDIILEIDWQGAREIKAQMECVSIFILPPSKPALLQRLQDRKQDSSDTIALRMSEAEKEMSHFHEYDYIVVNDKFEEAALELSSIIRAQRLKTVKQKERYAALLNQLQQ